MNFNLIYAKTASGEEATRERTRVMQRNMRMLLILIDAKASVADLCLRTGNSALVEEALLELERGGFIEPLTTQNPILTQSKDLAQEIKTAAMEPRSQFSTFGDKYAPESDGLATAPGKVGASLAAAAEGVTATAKDLKVKVTQAMPSLLDRLKTMVHERRVRASAQEEEIRMTPVRRTGVSASMRWPMAMFLGISGVVICGVLTAVFFPYDRYLPEVEAALTQASGQPASIGAMRVSFYPKPGLFLSDVRLGREGEGNAGQGGRISEMRLLPEVGSLMAPKKIMSLIVLSGVLLPADGLAGVFSVFDSLAKPSSRLGVQRVLLEKTDLTLSGLGFLGMDGEIKLATDGRFEMLSLNSPDRTLHLEATPLDEWVDIKLEGYSWRPTQDSPFIFDSLSVKGRLEGAVFLIDNMNLRIFDGLVHGVVRLRASPQPSMDGAIVFERINAKRLGTAIGIGPQFEGDTSGSMKFSATTDSWPAIFSAIQSDGEFSIGRGSVSGFNFAEAARLASASPTRGGTTRFEQLQGKFKRLPEYFQFFNLTLTSGLMQSVGQMTVSKELQLSGGMEVQMSGTANQMHVPVSIGGSLATPLLQAGKR